MDDFTIPDDTACVRSLLILDADLRLLVTDNDTNGDERVNVYCQELPETLANAQARNAVVVQDATGGPGPQGYSHLREPYYNVYCLGETPEMAKLVYLRVHEILRQVRRQVVDTCLFHSFDQVNPPSAKRDAQTKWPYSLSVWKSLSSDVPAT